LAILFFKVDQEDIVLKNGTYRVDDPMKGTLRGGYDSQDKVMKEIPSIAATDLKGDEKDSRYNENDNDERATASPEIHHLNN
jgi:hypothetical protein